MKKYLSVIDISSDVEYRCALLVTDEATQPARGKVVETFFEENCELVVDVIYGTTVKDLPQFVVSKHEYTLDPVNINDWVKSAFKLIKLDGATKFASYFSRELSDINEVGVENLRTKKTTAK